MLVLLLGVLGVKSLTINDVENNGRIANSDDDPELMIIRGIAGVVTGVVGLIAIIIAIIIACCIRRRRLQRERENQKSSSSSSNHHHHNQQIEATQNMEKNEV